MRQSPQSCDINEKWNKSHPLSYPILSSSIWLLSELNWIELKSSERYRRSSSHKKDVLPNMNNRDVRSHRIVSYRIKWNHYKRYPSNDSLPQFRTSGLCFSIKFSNGPADHFPLTIIVTFVWMPTLENVTSLLSSACLVPENSRSLPSRSKPTWLIETEWLHSN